jgi:multimeric flavodoxin WrbA
MDSVSILGLMGSPRRKGNSRILLDRFLEGAGEEGAVTRTLILEDLSYSPCRACGGCDKTGICVVKDDMQLVYEEVKKAGGLVVASPVHFGSMSGRAKMAIDRFQCFWAAKYLLGKARIRLEEGRLGFFICTGGMKPPRFCQNALEIAKLFFTITNIRLAGELCFREVDAAGAILDHPTAMEEAFQAGRTFARKVRESLQEPKGSEA